MLIEFKLDQTEEEPFKKTEQNGVMNADGRESIEKRGK